MGFFSRVKKRLDKENPREDVRQAYRFAKEKFKENAPKVIAKTKEVGGRFARDTGRGVANVGRGIKQYYDERYVREERRAKFETARAKQLQARAKIFEARNRINQAKELRQQKKVMSYENILGGNQVGSAAKNQALTGSSYEMIFGTKDKKKNKDPYGYLFGR